MTRNKRLDFIKGIGILLVVAYHAGLGYGINAAHWFHVPLFFMASGYFFRVENMSDGRGLWRYVPARIKRLYVPYVVFWGAGVLLTNVFVAIHVYDPSWALSWRDIRRDLLRTFIFGTRHYEAVGALWFLPTMFCSTVIYAVVCRVLLKLRLNEVRWMTLFAGICLLFGRFAEKDSPWYLGGAQVIVAFALVHVGRLLRLVEFDRRLTSRLGPLSSAVMALIAATLLCDMNIGSKEAPIIFTNSYPSGCLLLLGALLGWTFCSLTYEVIRETKIAAVVEYVGRHAMPIIIFQFLAFKCVAIIAVFLHGDSLCDVARYPVCCYEYWWWIPYTVAGVSIPLLIGYTYGLAMKTIRTSRT